MEPNQVLIDRAQAFILKQDSKMKTAELMAVFAVEMRVEHSMHALAKKLENFLKSCDSCGGEADNILCDKCLNDIKVGSR
jgi:hypothetical protein